VALGAERTPDLILAKENTIEGRFAFRVPTLFFRVFIRYKKTAN
jgi:hypothetical protein